MSRQLLITDLDNTLYDWNTYFATAFRGMVHALARELAIDEDVLIEDFKSVFRRQGNVEYSFSIQELECTKQLSDEAVTNLIRIGRGTFRRIRAARLKCYDGVEDALRWVQEQGIGIVAVTNAPTYLATQRLYELGVDRYVEGLIAWEGPPVPSNASRYGIALSRSLIRPKSRVTWVAPIPLAELKPSTRPYEMAMSRYGATAQSTWVMGDSLAKDLQPAGNLGITTILAEYGLQTTEKNLSTLLRVTHWTAQDVEDHYADNEFVPDYSVSGAVELKSILPLNSPTLF